MPYVPTIWTNREVEKPRTYNLQANGDGTTTLLPAEGNIISEGTPITAENLNNIENYLNALNQVTEILEKGVGGSNGHYIRWTNGMLINWGWYTAEVNTGTYGALHACTLPIRNFAYEFSHSTYYVGITPYFTEAVGMDIRTIAPAYFEPRVYCGVAMTAQSRQFAYFAFGRWKEDIIV